MLTHQEIYDNRMKWAKFLQEPERKKIRGKLEGSVDSEERCCLGHACKVLGLERIADHNGVAYRSTDARGGDMSFAVAPNQLINMLGLDGSVGYGVTGFNARVTYTDGTTVVSLSGLNDHTDMTPQEIGAYLESVVMGGRDTPFSAIQLETPNVE